MASTSISAVSTRDMLKEIECGTALEVRYDKSLAPWNQILITADVV